MTLVHNLPLNSKVLVWRKSSNWTRPYHLLVIKNKICYIQLPSGPTRFRNISIKPYFRPKNTHDIKLDELKATTKPGELEATAKLDKLKTPLPTLKVPQKPTELAELAIKHS